MADRLLFLRAGADELQATVFKIRPEQRSFWWHFDPQRIAVPRYQFFFRVGLWILFLVCYTLAIQTPDRGFGPEDIILYTQLLGYLVEDLVKVRVACLCFVPSGRRAGLTPVSAMQIYKIGIYATISVWQIVNWLIYSLAAVAFMCVLSSRSSLLKATAASE